MPEDLFTWTMDIADWFHDNAGPLPEEDADEFQPAPPLPPAPGLVELPPLPPPAPALPDYEAWSSQDDEPLPDGDDYQVDPEDSQEFVQVDSAESDYYGSSEEDPEDSEEYEEDSEEDDSLEDFFGLNSDEEVSGEEGEPIESEALEEAAPASVESGESKEESGQLMSKSEEVEILAQLDALLGVAANTQPEPLKPPQDESAPASSDE